MQMHQNICYSGFMTGLYASRRFAPTALMLGNLVTGTSVLAPAGMLPELAVGLDVSIHTAGLLITFGALMLCVGSPLTAGLRGAPVDLKTWGELGRNRIVVLLLLVTTLQMSGQFVVFTFMGPLLKILTEADANQIGIVFGIYGLCGFIGVVVASRIVDSWG